jgi:hypothetical protein
MNERTRNIELRSQWEPTGASDYQFQIARMKMKSGCPVVAKYGTPEDKIHHANSVDRFLKMAVPTFRASETTV